MNKIQTCTSKEVEPRKLLPKIVYLIDFCNSKYSVSSQTLTFRQVTKNEANYCNRANALHISSTEEQLKTNETLFLTYTGSPQLIITVHPRR